MTDAQTWQIAQALTGKTSDELQTLGISGSAEALEFLARLDGSLQYRWFNENLEGQLRAALADDYHRQSPEQIEAEVSRIRNQVFGAFTNEELREWGEKLRMERAEAASESEILAWLEKNYHWLKTTNPFETQILTKAHGLMSLEVDVLGFGGEVRDLNVGNDREYRTITMFVANCGPNGRTMLPLQIVVPPEVLNHPEVLENFFVLWF